MKQRLIILLGVIVLGLMSGCTQGTTGNVIYEQEQFTQVSQQQYIPNQYEVNITRWSFSPKTLTVRQGDQVTFTNIGQEPTKILETTTYLFETKRMENGDFFTTTFSKPGIYKYEVQRDRLSQRRYQKEQLGSGTITVVVR